MYPHYNVDLGGTYFGPTIRVGIKLQPMVTGQFLHSNSSL